jgi:hypothetical protein
MPKVTRRQAKLSLTQTSNSRQSCPLWFDKLTTNGSELDKLITANFIRAKYHQLIAKTTFLQGAYQQYCTYQQLANIMNLPD